MTHRIDMVIDLQYGSTGKGLIAGYMAKRNNYDSVICAFATNAGHTYIDKSRNINMMTQQLPTGISSPTVKNVFLGPGSLIHMATLKREYEVYNDMMLGKRLIIHPHAAIVEDYHAANETQWGMTKMGSTAKGVGAAMIERIRRDTVNPNVVGIRGVQDHSWLRDKVVTLKEYDCLLHEAENILIEGAQGFGLSIYHGAYPFTTSRDVTPWQIAADCGLPFNWASRINITGTLRTYPIRVNNRDGSSGPCYIDQTEIQFSDIHQNVEVTTVTKLPRRVFTFSHDQLEHALWHCGHYWKTDIFLNFMNYLPTSDAGVDLVKKIQEVTIDKLNPPTVKYFGYGADDSDILLAGIQNEEINNGY